MRSVRVESVEGTEPVKRFLLRDKDANFVRRWHRTDQRVGMKRESDEAGESGEGRGHRAG
jgi:hypothetical protein